jgi:hypothetical protein
MYILEDRILQYAKHVKKVQNTPIPHYVLGMPSPMLQSYFLVRANLSDVLSFSLLCYDRLGLKI